MINQDDTYYVHYFHPTDPTDRALNGLSLSPSRFRKYDKPDPVLVSWHYTQTVRMRIRGYSVGMLPARWPATCLAFRQRLIPCYG